jgi:hypothetical protein
MARQVKREESPGPAGGGGSGSRPASYGELNRPW